MRGNDSLMSADSWLTNANDVSGVGGCGSPVCTSRMGPGRIERASRPRPPRIIIVVMMRIMIDDDDDNEGNDNHEYDNTGIDDLCDEGFSHTTSLRCCSIRCH